MPLIQALLFHKQKYREQTYLSVSFCKFISQKRREARYGAHAYNPCARNHLGGSHRTGSMRLHMGHTVKTCLQSSKPGRWGGSVGRGARGQAWDPECIPRTPKGGSRSHKFALWCPHSTHTQGRASLPTNDALKPKGRERGRFLSSLKSFTQSRVVVKVTL